MKAHELQTALLRAAQAGRLGHFFILEGRAGQEDKALEWIETLVRRYWSEVEGLKVPLELKNDPDLWWFKPLDAEGEERDYRLEDLDELKKFLSYRPIRARRRFVVMENVKDMTKAVGNQLLKTLEEPEGEVVFLWPHLQGHQLLPTLVSRAQNLRLAWPLESKPPQLIPELRKKFSQGLTLASFLEDYKKQWPQLLQELLTYEASEDAPASVKQELLELLQESQKADVFNQSVTTRLVGVYAFLGHRWSSGR